MRNNIDRVMDPDTLEFVPKKTIVTNSVSVDTVLGNAFVTLVRKKDEDWWEIFFESHPGDRIRFRATNHIGKPVSQAKAAEMAKMYAGRILDSLRGYNG